MAGPISQPTLTTPHATVYVDYAALGRPAASNPNGGTDLPTAAHDPYNPYVTHQQQQGQQQQHQHPRYSNHQHQHHPSHYQNGQHRQSNPGAGGGGGVGGYWGGGGGAEVRAGGGGGGGGSEDNDMETPLLAGGESYEFAALANLDAFFTRVYR